VEPSHEITKHLFWEQVAEKTCHDLDALDQAYGEIHRAHPFQHAPDFVASLRDLLARPDFKSIVELE
jgi:hypothetical protein